MSTLTAVQVSRLLHFAFCLILLMCFPGKLFYHVDDNDDDVKFSQTPQQQQQQQQKQQQQQPSTFGSFGQPQQPATTGTSIFGSGGTFGQQNKPATGFGGGTFGSTSRNLAATDLVPSNILQQQAARSVLQEPLDNQPASLLQVPQAFLVNPNSSSNLQLGAHSAVLVHHNVHVL